MENAKYDEALLRFPALEFIPINVALNYRHLNQVIQIDAHPCFELNDLDRTLQLSHDGYRTTRDVSDFLIPIDGLPSSLRTIDLALVLQNKPRKAWREGFLGTASDQLTNRNMIHVIASSTSPYCSAPLKLELMTF